MEHVEALRMRLPKLEDVSDLPQDPAYPVGYASAPNGPGGLVQSLGVASVIAFAGSYNWDTKDQQKIALNWAKDTVNHCAWAATMRDYQKELTDEQKRSIQLSCVSAGVFFGGRRLLPVVWGYVAGRAQALPGLAFAANFNEGDSSFLGQTSSEKGPADAKELAFESLISDVRQGIYTPTATPTESGPVKKAVK
jgi:hypothetical protein